MTARPRLSVVVSTHDRPDALLLALGGVAAAAAGLDVEAIVADDGSGPDTAAAAGRFRAASPIPVLHVRQEHRGFRLAAARNLAARSASGDVLVFTDGDCILHPRALRAHASAVRPGVLHTGARAFLDGGSTAEVLAGRMPLREAWRRAILAAAWPLLRRRIANALQGGLRLKPRPKLCAANCAIHIEDLARINGFDERFVGWGLEDDDLARRARRAGARIADGTLRCLALHLFHPVHESHRPDSRRTPNHLYYHRGSFLTRARRGLVERSLESLGWEVLGDPPAALAGAVAALGAPPAGRRPEATLIFPGTSARDRARARGEATVEVPHELLGADPAAFRAFLERSL